MGAQWCSVADSQLSQYMKMVHVGRLLAGGTEQAVQRRCSMVKTVGKRMWCVCVFVWAYFPIDREAIKGNFLPPIPPSLTVATAGT